MPTGSLHEIERFWHWFEQEVDPSLAVDEVPSQDTIRELDEKMLSLGLSWELGPAPDGSDDWGFAVSFGADQARIERARRVVDQSPRLKRCQVLLGKPPKQWQGVLDLRTADGLLRFFTADWICYLLPMGDGMAIMVDPVGVDDVPEDVLAHAVAIAVQSELGELRYAKEVRDLSVVQPERAETLPGIRCRMADLRAAKASS